MRRDGTTVAGPGGRAIGFLVIAWRGMRRDGTAAAGPGGRVIGFLVIAWRRMRRDRVLARLVDGHVSILSFPTNQVDC
jgi:hypothetical protein